MFSNATRLCTLYGFEIRVDPSWLLIAALITWSLSRYHFPLVVPDASQPEYITMALVAMLLFFASLLLHELAHSVVARAYGLPIKKITLFLFGGVAELEAEPKTAAIEFQVALAGPVMSLFLAFAFWVFEALSRVVGLGPAVTEILGYLSFINLILAVFNLLPAFPLDGGRVLRAWLWHRTGDLLQATERAARSGTVLAYVLMGFGMLALFQGAVVGGLWQILIGGFILMAARSSYQAQLAKITLADRTVADVMTRNVIVTPPNASLEHLVNQVMLPHRVSFVPVVENGVVLGHIDMQLLAGVDRENWADTRVDDVFASLADTPVVPSDLGLFEMMERIGETRRRKFIVMDHGMLSGVISLSDLTAYMSMAAALYTGKAPSQQNARNSY